MAGHPARLTAIKLFARWLAAEEHFDADPITAIRPPKLEQAPIADLSEGEVRRMLKVCEATTLQDKRDKAILLLLTETGLRSAELLALDMGDIDLDDCLLIVRKGKGGKSRRVRFSPVTAAAVDRYVRARRTAIRRRLRTAVGDNPPSGRQGTGRPAAAKAIAKVRVKRF